MRGPLEILAELGCPPVTGVLQVGASSGQELEYFRAAGVAYGAFIEPLDGPFSILQQRCTMFPGFLPIQSLCGSRDGEQVSFHVASNNGESSSIFLPKSHLNYYPMIHFAETKSLHSFTLDRIFAAIAQQNPEIAQSINLLFMDTQGAELEVLKGANNVLSRVNSVYTEVGHGHGYDGAAPVEDIIALMRLHGFRLYELVIDRAGWGNAMFIRG